MCTPCTLCEHRVQCVYTVYTVCMPGLGVYNKPYDYIHLGKQGIRMLANIFKNGIFKQFVDGRSYSGVLVNRGGAGYTPFPVLS